MTHRPEGLPDLTKEKSHLEVALHLHDQANRRFYERRNLEWRTGFTVWSSLVAVMILVSNLDPDLAWWRFGIVVTASITWTLGHLVWENRYVIKRSMEDWSEGILLDELIRKAHGFPVPDYGEYSRRSSHYWLVITTGAIGVVSIVVALVAALCR